MLCQPLSVIIPTLDEEKNLPRLLMLIKSQIRSVIESGFGERDVMAKRI